MFHSYNIERDTLHNYNKTFAKKTNKPINKALVLKFSLLIFFAFCIISYISITPSFLLLNNKMNSTFFIVLIICIYLVYISLKVFFKSLNHTRIISNDILVNDFFKESYTITIDDNLKTLLIKTQQISITINLLNDINNICVFKHFISLNFYGNTVFLPNNDYIISFFKELNLI